MVIFHTENFQKWLIIHSKGKQKSIQRRFVTISAPFEQVLMSTAKGTQHYFKIIVLLSTFLRQNSAYTSVTFTLRRPYGGRRTPKSSDSCGCRSNSAVAAGPPQGHRTANPYVLQAAGVAVEL